jgi:hypothetical protein
MQHDTIPLGAQLGRGTELMLYPAIERWLERLGKEPAALRGLLAVLREHASYPSEPASTYELANQVLSRNAIRNPQAWYETYAQMRGFDPKSKEAETEAELLQFCWNVPWEKERLRRAIGLRNSPSPPPGIMDVVGAGWRKVTLRDGAVKASGADDYLAGCAGMTIWSDDVGY